MKIFYNILILFILSSVALSIADAFITLAMLSAKDIAQEVCFFYPQRYPITPPTLCDYIVTFAKNDRMFWFLLVLLFCLVGLLVIYLLDTFEPLIMYFREKFQAPPPEFIYVHCYGCYRYDGDFSQFLDESGLSLA